LAPPSKPHVIREVLALTDSFRLFQKEFGIGGTFSLVNPPFCRHSGYSLPPLTSFSHASTFQVQSKISLFEVKPHALPLFFFHFFCLGSLEEFCSPFLSLPFRSCPAHHGVQSRVILLVFLLDSLSSLSRRIVGFFFPLALHFPDLSHQLFTLPSSDRPSLFIWPLTSSLLPTLSLSPFFPGVTLLPVLMQFRWPRRPAIPLIQPPYSLFLSPFLRPSKFPTPD